MRSTSFYSTPHLVSTQSGSIERSSKWSMLSEANWLPQSQEVRKVRSVIPLRRNQIPLQKIRSTTSYAMSVSPTEMFDVLSNALLILSSKDCGNRILYVWMVLRSKMLIHYSNLMCRKLLRENKNESNVGGTTADSALNTNAKSLSAPRISSAPTAKGYVTVLGVWDKISSTECEH